MALSLEQETEYGVTVNYWRIGGVQEDFLAQALTVVLMGYVSAEARNNGKAPLTATQAITLRGEDYKPDATRADVYAALKALPAWAGAVDC